MRAAIQLDPTYAKGHHRLGTALQQLGRGAEAVGCFATAGSDSPGRTPHSSAEPTKKGRRVSFAF